MGAVETCCFHRNWRHWRWDSPSAGTTSELLLSPEQPPLTSDTHKHQQNLISTTREAKRVEFNVTYAGKKVWNVLPVWLNTGIAAPSSSGLTEAATCGLQLCQQLIPCMFNTPALLPSMIISIHPNPRKLSSSSSWAGTGQTKICSSKGISSCFPSCHPPLKPHGSCSIQGRWRIWGIHMDQQEGALFPGKLDCCGHQGEGMDPTGGGEAGVALQVRDRVKLFQKELLGIHSFRKGPSEVVAPRGRGW